jgi:hypothetical protein
MQFLEKSWSSKFIKIIIKEIITMVSSYKKRLMGFSQILEEIKALAKNQEGEIVGDLLSIIPYNTETTEENVEDDKLLI